MDFKGVLAQLGRQERLVQQVPQVWELQGRQVQLELPGLQEPLVQRARRVLLAQLEQPETQETVVSKAPQETQGQQGQLALQEQPELPEQLELPGQLGLQAMPAV